MTEKAEKKGAPSGRPLTERQKSVVSVVLVGVVGVMLYVGLADGGYPTRTMWDDGGSGKAGWRFYYGEPSRHDVTDDTFVVVYGGPEDRYDEVDVTAVIYAGPGRLLSETEIRPFHEFYILRIQYRPPDGRTFVNYYTDYNLDGNFLLVAPVASPDDCTTVLETDGVSVTALNGKKILSWAVPTGHGDVSLPVGDFDTCLHARFEFDGETPGVDIYCDGEHTEGFSENIFFGGVYTVFGENAVDVYVCPKNENVRFVFDTSSLVSYAVDYGGFSVGEWGN